MSANINNSKNIQAIQSMDISQGIYLKVKGKGENQHLVAKKKGWFGRLAMRLRTPRPFSKKVMEYYERSSITIDNPSHKLLKNLGEINQNCAQYREVTIVNYLITHRNCIQLHLDDPLNQSVEDERRLRLLKTEGDKLAQESNFTISPAIQVIALLTLKLSNQDEPDSEDVEQFAQTFVDQAQLNAIANKKEAEKNVRIHQNHANMINDLKVRIKSR